AEMRGVVDAPGRSPFWEAIGRHCFDIDFPKADHLSMVNKRFIADLMPKHPIYIPLLPKEAQAVIGEVHEQTRPAMRILADEGFECCDQVDIFEGGPVVRCALDQVRAIKESRKGAVGRLEGAPIESEEYVISNCREPFRAARGKLDVDESGAIVLPADLAAALALQPGHAVRHLNAFGNKLNQQNARTDPADDSLPILISREMGKPLWESLGELDAMINKIILSIHAMRERRSPTVQTTGNQTTATRYRPHGVIA